MSLTLTLHSISGLKGHGDRVAKITFRELSHSTRLLQNCGADALFGEKFEWPVASDVQDGDVIEVCLYNSLVFGRNKVVGRFVMVLQEVVKVGFLEVSETLLDDNNCALQATIRLTLTYSAPDGTVGSWQTEEFRPSGRPNSAFELDEESDARSLRSDTGENMPLIRSRTSDARIAMSSISGLKRLRNRKASHADILEEGSLNVPASRRKPITAIPPHLQQQRQFNFDPLSDGQSIVSNNVITEPCTNKRSKPEMASESQIGLRNNQFQVTITVIEARQLMGTNMDPVVEVKVGDECRFTSQKSSTNCPYYNEVFVFDFNIPRGVFLDKMVTLTVLHSKNMLRSGTLVGRFKMDVRTVYEAPDHQFFHRWAILTDGKNAACKGYLKMDISVLAKGDMLRSIKPTDNDKEDDIENNLLLPHGITERVMARYYFRVFYAEGLPKMSSDTVGKIKSVIKGENRDLIDPYVEISFAGQKRRTSTEHTYEAQWNEMLQFTELFPALCQRVQIQVRNDGMQDSVIATHFLDMSKISNQGDKGYLPTFGPTYINLYGSPRGYSVTGEHGELNDGIGEGVAFRGRLVVACHIELIDEAADDNAMEDSDDEAEPRPIQSLSENSLGRVEEFFLFTTFLEASMIDKKATDKPISFEVSIGNYGNVVDGKNIPSKSDRQKDADDDHDDADTKRTSYPIFNHLFK
ncbi:Oidioi.mRNA.OKI2018_I69.PAR.g10877.t1.cds [Oikopleura dioica]|uniref:Oidioi.mRNA.OKI2018_I69.PAR.g10877.t1.cds n=1 Tax=Oikopleura dioica TaxID=34765 RepID=A0ABN7RXZ4_OIKDI|nr:Oidioi.mRNA.OKI2018_I69.PAR.g10877.t1.cds [Oikopleura dioica]